MNRFQCAIPILLLVLPAAMRSQSSSTSVTWLINRTDSIGGYSASALPRRPGVISTPYGAAVKFSCFDSSALLVNANPLGGDTTFTLEVFFRPDTTLLSGTNNEQRFIHIRNTADDNRRILMETRVLSNQRWVLDTYIKSETSNLTLVDSSKTHSMGEWHHVAMTYGNGIMQQFVDGVLIKAGAVKFLPINVVPRTSIGARQDPRSWFNGAIRMVKFTKRVLVPAEFTIPVVSGVKDRNVRSNEMDLNQNYPNPFNPSTTFSVSLASSEDAALKVFNLLGDEVATVYQGLMTAGTHQIAWSAADLSAGVYFYRLQSGSNAITKKLILLK